MLFVEYNEPVTACDVGRQMSKYGDLYCVKDSTHGVYFQYLWFETGWDIPSIANAIRPSVVRVNFESDVDMIN